MKITITDIARDTGLAVSTISKYLNHKNILPENEALVEASIKKLGYTPNRIAQGLRAKSSHTVALLIPSKNNYFWGNSVSYITSFLWEQGYVCTIHTYPPEKEKQLQLGQLLINNIIRGLIAVTGTLDQVSDSFSSDYVTSENYLGGYLAGSYLARKNHQRIGFVAGRRDAYTIVQRTSGFLNALKDAKLPAYPELYSYDLCLGGISLLNERGISIPEQMSVIVFDDDRMFSCFSPSITVIAQDFLQIGVEAARLLLEQFQNLEKSSPKICKVPVQLIERESVCNFRKELP